MAYLDIQVRARVARPVGNPFIVCGNKDYMARFDFDEDWDAYDEKTARFVFNGQYIDVQFTGNECPVPMLYKTSSVKIGVYVAGLSTTSPAVVRCVRSVLCGGEEETGTTYTDTPLTLTQNGTTETPDGVRYNPITVNVPSGGDIDLSEYQKQVDETLETESKEVAGAINELNDGKVDKFKTSSPLLRVYAQGASADGIKAGDEIGIAVATTPASWQPNRLAYLQQESAGDIEPTSGYLLSKDPTKPYHTVSKNYLDQVVGECVKFTDYPSPTSAGVVKVNSKNHGMQISQAGEIYPLPASEAEVDERKNYRWLTPARLDYFIKVGMTTNKLTLTDEEKTSACEWLGVTALISGLLARIEELERKVNG